MSEIVWPPLTTIRQPIKDLAEQAVQLLVESQSGREPDYTCLPFELIVRESTCPPRQSAAA
jgi:LacI family transcriptional regulator